MQRKIPAIVLGLIFLLTQATSAVVLYDGSAGGTPPSQGWLTYQQVPFTGGPHYTSTGGKTELNTTSNAGIYAGFHNYNTTLTAHQNALFPVLDRTVGYQLSIADLKITTENHGVDNDRAGFSLIVLSSDLKGIELGFWSDQVWAQADSPLFTHAESTSLFNPGLAHDYDLLVLGSTYTLFADGGVVPILTGTLRDYSAFGAPYNRPSFLFLGDNTTSASAQAEFTKIILVPEPTVLAGVMLGALLMRRRTNFGSSITGETPVSRLR